MAEPPPIHLPPISGPSPQECDLILGMYMRMWGNVERAVAELIRKLLDTDMTTSQVVIRALGDMRAQRELAAELGKHRLIDEDRPDLDGLLQRIKSAATKRNRLVHGKWILHLQMRKPPNPKPLTAKSAKWVRVYEPVDREEVLALGTGRNQKLNAAFQFWPERIVREAEAAQILARDLEAFVKRSTLKPPRIPLPVEW
jgi:hypothetical protein